MNRIDTLMEAPGRDGLLSLYFTAGYPGPGDTLDVLRALQEGGCDMAEIGMPFSDPLADGPVIQRASLDALRQGMCIARLMEQLTDMRRHVAMPVLLMGYINPVLHYGLERFLDHCADRGVDGLILPDLPWEEYLAHHKPAFDERGLHLVPLIAPQTPDERMRQLDKTAGGFIYMVASAGITGNIKTSEDYRTAYFERVAGLGLRHQRMIGFGVKDHAGFRHACQHARGAIVGTAFVQHLKANGTDQTAIAHFIKGLREGK